MIVPMKHLTLLCLAGDRERALVELRDIGVVHVTDYQPPAGDELEEARARADEAERALAALPKPAEPAQDDVVDAPADEVVAETLALLTARKSAEERRASAERELAKYVGIGDFDLEAVRELQSHDVSVVLVGGPLEASSPAPDGIVLLELGRDKERRYAALAAAGHLDIESFGLGEEWSLVPWPDRPLAELRDTAAASERELGEAESRLDQLASARPAVVERVADLQAARRFAEVRAGMGQGETVSYLTGFVPARDADEIRSAAAEHGWGVVFNDPVPGEDVPVLIHYKRWVKPIRTVLDFLRIYPGYWETDVGWAFLVFFSLFFAMLVGDAGYGTLLIITTFVLQRRFRTKAPSYMWAMMYIVSAATLVWGVITGNYFGIPNIPPFLESLQITWLSDRENLIYLCFIIGAIHLSIAHIWNIITLSRGRVWTKALAQLGWLLIVWGMFLLAGQTVLGKKMPSFTLYMMLTGIVLVALFMATRAEFKKEWINHALLPLTLVSNFVDILSYIRLFAVGYASVAVLAAFNDMAASIGFGNVFTAVAASLLLLFANALNLVLCALGVLVHAVRLNTLEFSTHKGLQWAGYDLYKPFAKHHDSAT
jgi:V/A-type H+/Na+-transporting ATPase subunit I